MVAFSTQLFLMPYHFLFKAYALKGTSGRFLAGSVGKTVGWSLKISKFGHLKILKILKFSQKKKDLERAEKLKKVMYVMFLNE